MNPGPPTHKEWNEIYASITLTVGSLLLSGAICLATGLVYGAYSVINDIPSTSSTTTISATTGCLAPVFFLVVGGLLTKVGITLWRKLG